MMFLTEIKVEKADFDQCSWQEVIASSEKKYCDLYLPLLGKKVGELELQGDTKSQAVFALLYHLCSFTLAFDKSSEPFIPQSALIDDFNESHLNVLEEIAVITNDAELRARIADILWYRRKRNYKMAQLAISSYIKSAKILEDPENWKYCSDRIERAVSLAASLGKNNPAFRDVISYIESVLDKYKNQYATFLLAKLMELLLRYKEGLPSVYISLAEKIAMASEISKDILGKWHIARTYWEIKAKWHAIDNDPQNERLARLNAAETYVKEAEDVLHRSDSPYSIASHSLLKAMEAYRRIEGTQKRTDEIHKKLLEYEKKSMTDFTTFSSPSIDISSIIENARNLVKDKSLVDALFALALVRTSPSKVSLRKGLETNEFRFNLWIPAQIITKEGKVVAKRPGMYGNSEDTESALQAEMFRRAILEQSLHAQGVIQPAIDQINLEYNVRISDLWPIVSNNPFIPPGREYIFAKGLHAVFMGDLMTVAHLLTPQIENSIRHLLVMKGGISSGLEQGIQGERSLNVTLYKPEILELLGEDIVFDLQGLLVEKFGSNLRNKMAHGLIDQSEFYSWQIVYLWWLVLRLCVLPIYTSIYTQQESENK